MNGNDEVKKLAQKLSRDDKFELAKTSEQMDRYEDVALVMKLIVEEDPVLTLEQRNLLSIAYKNVVGSRRSQHRTIKALEVKSNNPNVVKELKDKIEEELKETCQEVLSLIEDNLTKGCSSDDEDAKVFYYKMKGDYYRYMCEINSQDEETKQKAKDAYSDAEETAKSMTSTNPIKLGLSLNHSVFYYEVMQDRDKACEFAKQAFDNAIAELDQLKEDSYKDSTLIMQLLRDNLTLWTSDQDTQVGDDDES